MTQEVGIRLPTIILGQSDQWETGERCQAVVNVEVTWGRWHYGGHLGRKDARFTSEFWKQAALSLKIHEVVTLGWDKW